MGIKQFEQILSKVLDDSRARHISSLYITQILIILDNLGLLKGDEEDV